MKQYKIFKHPNGITETVKQGWSWPGFFFSCFWAMVKKMWGLGAGIFIGFLALGFVIGAAGGGSGGDALINIIALIVNIIFGVNGNSWREKNLTSRGFAEVNTVAAANSEAAIALYLEGTPADEPKMEDDLVFNSGSLSEAEKAVVVNFLNYRKRRKDLSTDGIIINMERESKYKIKEEVIREALKKASIAI